MPTLLESQQDRSITPSTDVIHYMRRQSFNMSKVFKELIDNAIDVNATQIMLTMTGGVGRGRITITDNGNGCTDLRNMLKLGHHVPHLQTQVGQYGVGLKDAAVWSSKRITIESVCNGALSSVVLDWDVLMASGLWELPSPIEQTATDRPNGTRIDFTGLLHRLPPRSSLMEDLGQTYLPALRQGLQLLLKCEQESDFTPIKPFDLPPLLHQQQETITVGTKTARVTMGMVPPDVTLNQRGMLYLYGPRVIAERKRSGISPPEAVGDIFGWIEFGREWIVEKNKSDILDDLTPLEEEIERRFAMLMQLAAARRTSRPLEEITQRLNQRLKQLPYKGKPRKARRPGPHIKTGTVAPTGTGPKHTGATETQPGSTFVERQYLSIRMAHLGTEGEFCRLVDDVVIINEDAPLILQCTGNTPLLNTNIIWAIATHLCNKSENPQLVMPWLEQYAPSIRIYEMVNFLLGLPMTTTGGHTEENPA